MVISFFFESNKFNEHDFTSTVEYIAIRRAENMAKLTPIKAIRAKCLECSNGQFKEIETIEILCYIIGMGNHRAKGGFTPLVLIGGCTNALQTKERRAMQ